MRSRIMRTVREVWMGVMVWGIWLSVGRGWGAETNVVAGTGEQETWLVYIFSKGGIFMYPIVLLGFVGIYFIVDAFLLLRKKKLSPPELKEQLKGLLKEKKYEEALKVCEERPCALTRILGAGLRVRHRGKVAMEEAFVEHGAREGMVLRARISYLNTIAVIEPMLGLLGTVSGMIKAFANVAAMGMGKSSVLANNISEALITTYGGLVVAIPLMAVFLHLRNQVNSMIVHVEDEIGELVDLVE
ncbi:MAG: MotA/TolQ/ExbB proton channel family protein [bacterium]|nr:MotA/TolQ/ExbB proton channel family protein [bacterium]